MSKTEPFDAIAQPSLQVFTWNLEHQGLVRRTHQSVDVLRGQAPDVASRPDCLADRVRCDRARVSRAADGGHSHGISLRRDGMLLWSRVNDVRRALDAHAAAHANDTTVLARAKAAIQRR